jgi:hypothetical protein
MAVAGCGSAAAASPPGARRVATPRTASLPCPAAVRREGMIAFAARGQLKLLDLATCRARVLANATATDLRFSADGRWLAYSHPVGGPGMADTATRGLFVVAVRGGRVRSPLGAGVIAWSWAPGRDLLYGLTSQGAVVSASPTGRRRVVSADLGAGSAGLAALQITPDGRRAIVDRSRCARSSVVEVSTIDLATGARTALLRGRQGPVILAGLSPTGRWLLFWPDELCSASLAADGMPLEAVRTRGGTPVRAVRHMLLYSDFVTWCGRRLIAASGPSRETQLASRLVQTGPSAWRQRTIDPARTLSWVSPSCAPSGRLLAAAAGPHDAPIGFGHQHRSIWLLRADGHPVRRLSRPPASEPDLSDEAPRFSSDGRWILFVRTRVVPAGRSALSEDTIELVRADGGGAVPIVHFTSGDFSYYDHFGWPSEIAWFSGRPRPPRARAAGPCRMSQLAVRRGHSMAGLGNAGEYLSFTNSSARSCRLDGWPTLALIDARGTVNHSVIKIPGRPNLGYTSPTPATAFTLRPRRHADAAFGGSDGPTRDNRPCKPSYRTLRVGLPGSSRTQVLSAWIPYLGAYMPDCSKIALGPLAPSTALYHG